MRIMRRADQKLGIGQKLGRLSEVANFNRIHVVDVNSLMNIISIASQITAEISGNHMIPDRSPLIGVVESLIQITLKSKRLLAYLSIQLQVLERSKNEGSVISSEYVLILINKFILIIMTAIPLHRLKRIRI